MRNYRTMLRTALKTAVPVAAVLTLGGCGMFKTSGLSGRYEVNDPNRIAERAVAHVVVATAFGADAPADKATFNAILYDKDGRQFYGPDVLFEGEKVPVVAASGNNPSRYEKADIAYAAGKTYTVAVQGHTAATPPAPPALRVTSPVRTVEPDKDHPGQTITQAYFVQPAGQGVTISWTGGDPSRPVYIVIYGDPTTTSNNNPRRLYVKDNPQQSISDPDNYGLPIANTGSYAIPAEITERYLTSDGSTATRTVPTFANPSTDKTVNTRVSTIYVMQRTDTAKDGPLEASTITIAYAQAGVRSAGS